MRTPPSTREDRPADDTADAPERARINYIIGHTRECAYDYAYQNYRHFGDNMAKARGYVTRALAVIGLGNYGEYRARADYHQEVGDAFVRLGEMLEEPEVSRRDVYDTFDTYFRLVECHSDNMITNAYTRCLSDDWRTRAEWGGDE